MPHKTFPLQVQPGIRRDGTTFSGLNYIDGQWVRFYDSKPRKMGGFKQIIGTLPSIPRGIYVTPLSDNFKIYFGLFDSLYSMVIDQNDNIITPLTDITPVGFAADPNNIWQFDQMFSTVDNTSVVIAHAAPSALSISSTTETPVYKGSLNADVPFVSIGKSVSGGIVALQPYLFIFTNDGYVQWSNANDPTTFDPANNARVTSQKIVKGLATRGGNSSPAGLLWSLNSLIRVTFVPTAGAPNFRFDVVAGQSSILSSSSVIEWGGVYYWAGINNFLFYNGVVSELPNDMNLNFFYYNNPATGSGLNYPYKQRVWATKVEQYGEIWFFFPSGESVECDRAVIYNIRYKTWYDTVLPRGAGYFEQTFSDPLWTSNNNGECILWRHESGVDQNINGILTPIPSFYETCDLSWIATDGSGQWIGIDRIVDLYRFEPDATQYGDMTLTINGRSYARSPVVSSIPYAIEPTTPKIDLREQRRIMTLRFDSNVVGGFYQIGQPVVVLRIGDERP